MYSIAVANQKGGSGKTTTAVNLAAALSRRGYRVLLIDLDPQAQTSTYLRVEERNSKGTIFDAIMDSGKHAGSIANVVLPIYRGLTLLPSGSISADDELRLNSQPNRELRLAEILAPVKGGFDFAVFDCPPTLGVLTQNALMAANSVVLTIETSFFALHGVGKLLELIQNIRTQHAIRIFALATMYDSRTAFAREVLADMRSYFKDMMLSTVIRQNVKLRESTSFGQPIFSYARKSNGAQDYGAMADELLKKIVQGIEEMKKLVQLQRPAPDVIQIAAETASQAVV